MSHSRQEKKPAAPTKPAALQAAQLSPNGELNVMAAALLETKKELEDCRATLEDYRAALDAYQATYKYTEGHLLRCIEKAMDQGYDEGYRACHICELKTLYAAVAIALREQLGYGGHRLLRMLKAVDQQVVLCIDYHDLVEQLYAETGLELDLDDAVERLVLRNNRRKRRKRT